MNKVSITFLGTGNAIPTKLRNHSAIFLSYENENMLFDCGEGTQRQFRFAELSPAKITRIFITHWHGDHILGLPGLLQTLAMSGYTKTLQIYGPRGTKNFMAAIQKLMIDFRISVNIHEVVSGVCVDEKDFCVVAEQMEHGINTVAYSFIVKDKLRLDKKKIEKMGVPNSPILGKLQAGEDINFEGKKIKSKNVTYLEKGKKVTIILDTKYNENAVKLAKDSNLLIIESSFSSKDKEKAEEYEHLTAEDAAKIGKKAKVEKIILTHISQRYEHKLEIIEAEAKKIFKNTHIVKDFDKIEI